MSHEGLKQRPKNKLPPFLDLQLNPEARNRQISAWRNIVLDYVRLTKQYILDIQETAEHPLFNNSNIGHQLDFEFILVILSDLQRTRHAAPLDMHRHKWEIYWHTLEEWADIIYSYIMKKGAMDSTYTLNELTQAEHVRNEEFFELDADVLIKALRVLESWGKCKVILSDHEESVKFL